MERAIKSLEYFSLLENSIDTSNSSIDTIAGMILP